MAKSNYKQLVFDYLKTTPFEGKTPTQIGMALGYSYSSASSTVNSSIKSLLKESKITRYKDGHRVKYRINTEEKGAVNV